ncbi:hypothetical protein BHM03_00016963, partial [Ensete ventricosum]
ARERKRHGRWSKRMPLVRLELRDDYGLGDPVLYRGGFRKEEPKAILDGVAVSGLVGILRQLGDVAKLVLLASLHLDDKSFISGSDWLARIRDEQSSLVSTELPRFMMDSYEQCRDPPRLFLLDK